MMERRNSAALALAFLSLGLCTSTVLLRGDWAFGAATGPKGKSLDWPVYGGQAAGDHYSSLSQIDRKNVGRLRVAWKYDTAEQGSLETNPLIVGDVLYAYTPTQKVIALDASSGKLLWKFDSGIDGTAPARGLSYWTDGTTSRLFAGVMNFLYALDPLTGKPVLEFGEQGRIDLRKGLRDDYQSQLIALTTPGIIYKNLIIVGGRNPETHPAPPGDIRAFDVRTGALRWTFHTIPHPGEFGYETWPKDTWKRSGAANNWAGMSLDAKRGIVFVPTGSAVFDFYGGDRLGNDLFADTLLALDAETGKRLWYFQGVHHDVWDRDFPSPPALLTVMHNGKQVEALAQTTKQGYLYVFNRVTGEPLFPIEEHSYPASTVPGEVTSPTQPKPVTPEPFARQMLTEDMLTNRTPEAHAWALAQFRTFRSGGQFLPFAVDKQTVVFPGFDGGAEWGGPAVDPVRGVIYVNANEMAWTGGLTANKPAGNLGEGIYQNQCAVCHGENRAGSPPTFPSLIDLDKHLTPQEIADRIHHGKGRMPAFPNLNDTQLAALMKFLKNGPVVAASDKKEMAPAPGAFQEDVTNPEGAAAYKDHCAICHGDRQEGIGSSFPALLGVGQRFSSQQITDLIHQGKGRMPGFPKLQGEELDALMRYLINVEYRFTGYRKFLDPDSYPAIAPPWGTLNAIDLNTGKYLWKIPFGEYPSLAAKGMTDTGSENYGGPILTASGLLFIGATVYDRTFHAYDSRTGHLLWRAALPLAGVATPATYMVNGKQYVVIACGGGRDHTSPSGGIYVAFALP
jgi:glucose dehydrogenase